MRTFFVLAVLWVISLVISNFLFAGLSATVGYQLIFSWWFVAYFTREMVSTTLFEILSIFPVLIFVLGLIYLIGWYDVFYRGVPEQFSFGVFLLMVLHSIFLVSPLLLNKFADYLSELVSISLTKKRSE